MTSCEILYESDAALVCVKPVGTLSEDADDGSLPGLLAAREGAQGRKPLTVHRLDREVGGLMVYAKTPGAAAELTRQINDGRLSKEYLAVLCGLPGEPEGALRDLLFHDRQKNKTYVTDRIRRGVREALLEYKVLATAREKDGGLLSLCLIRLLTGRTHQIRAQFASRRLPLYGDARYGGARRGQSIALFSFRLGFTDPLTGERVEINKEPPDGIFEMFRSEIRKV